MPVLLPINVMSHHLWVGILIWQIDSTPWVELEETLPDYKQASPRQLRILFGAVLWPGW